jgi:hypothetical protein
MLIALFHFFSENRCQQNSFPYTALDGQNILAKREKIDHFIPPRLAGKSGGIKVAALSFG